MDATTMQLTLSLVDRLTRDFREFQFTQGQTTMWEPSSRTIYYRSHQDDAELLHELGHALLGHTDYKHDIALLGYERDAWQEAERLAPAYQVKIDPQLIQDHLDTYRDWLHARSTCPTCQANGVQIKAHTYQCVACHSKWTVNEARTHALRRQKIK